MSIAFDSTTTPTSSTGVRGLCARTGSNEIVCNILNTNYFVRRYAASSGHAQQGSDFALPTGGSAIVADGGCAMLTADKVLCVSSSTNHYIVDLNTSTGTTMSATSDRVPYTARPQQVAGQNNLGGVGIAISSTTGKICIVQSNGTVSNTLLSNFVNESSETFQCIIPFGTANFLLGSSLGRIIEINSSGAVQKQYCIPERRRIVERASNYAVRQVIQLATYANYVLALTSLGEVFLFDHLTGRLMQTWSTPAANSSGAAMYYMKSNGPAVYCASAAASPQVQTNFCELDIAMTPVKHVDIATISGATALKDIEYCNGYLAITRNSNAIQWFTVGSPRSIETVTVTVEDASGNPVDGELTVIDDTLTDSKVLFSTPIGVAGRDVPVTDGKTGSGLWAVTKHFQGVQTGFKVHRNTT